MLFNWLNRLSRRPIAPRRPARPRLGVESLEDRAVPAVLYLDFGFGFNGGKLNVSDNAFDAAGIDAPDDLFGDGYTLTSLTDSVKSRMIDLNGDTLFNSADAHLLADRTVELVKRSYAPFAVDVRTAASGGLDTVRSLMDSVDVEVAYVFVAGAAPPGSTFVGIAPGTDGGDDAVFAFADSILANDNNRDGKNDAADALPTALARTACHEAGHSFGLEHTSGDVTAAVGDMEQGRGHGSDLRRRDVVSLYSRFDLPLDEESGSQNAYNELVNRCGVSDGPAYVTGTGCNDRITVTRVTEPGPLYGYALVQVEAFNQPGFVGLFDTASYYVSLGGGLTVEAGVGDDAIILDGTLGTTVTVRGGSEKDTVFVNGTGAAETVTVAPGEVRMGTTVVRADEVEGVTVSSGGGADAFTVAGTRAGVPVALFAGDGADTISVAGGTGPGDLFPSLAAIAGPLTIHGEGAGDLVTVTEGYTGAGGYYVVTATAISRTGSAAIAFDGVEGVTLTAGDFADTVVVKGTAAGTPVTVNAGGGDDTINFQLTTTGTKVTVNAGGGTDTLVGPTATSTTVWEVRSPDGGAVNSVHTFSSVENLTGGTGPDLFTFLPAGRVSGNVRGGGAPASNALDYTTYTTGVLANLTTGTATGVKGTVGGFGSVYGGAGNDALVGDASANVLVGLGGRDLLIGEAGQDTLDGGAGEDLLIGGVFLYANLDAAVTGVRDEWARTDLTFAQRMTRLGTVGARVPFLNGSTLTFKLDYTTVTDDGAADTLTGRTGNPNWYWAGAGDIKDAFSIG